MTDFDHTSLADAAGVDPWKMLTQLQSGDPAQIDSLAAAFYKAAGHMSEASDATEHSQTYAKAGYHVNQNSPLDASAEAAHTKASIVDGKERLPAIAKLLTTVATDLDSATKKAAGEVATLNSTLQRYEDDWNTYWQGVGHHFPDEAAVTKKGYIDDAVAAVKSHGATVKGYVTSYEDTLGTSLKSMADLGYIPPDAVDEGPGDVNLDDPNKDAGTTIDAAKNGDGAGVQRGVSTVALINAAIAANHGRVSDEEYSYLYQYYDKTAPYSAQIYDTVKKLPSDTQHATGTEWADGLLNLSKGGEQNTDTGLPPNTYGPGGELMGRSGLPPSVYNILNSDIGAVQSTDDPNSNDGTVMMRRAEWQDGHWVVDNYATDTGFANLLNMADPNMQGSTDFSKDLAETGIRWKQDISAVQHNTETYQQTTGLPDLPVEAMDAKLNLDDSAASAALSVASHNQLASGEVLLNDADRHAILGLHWDDGTGAAQMIASGTAPDPGNAQHPNGYVIDPATGKSVLNEAALKVMQDAGSDYGHFTDFVTDPVKNALTNLAITHLDSFATVPDASTDAAGNPIPSSVGDLVLPNGQHIQGVNLNSADAANFLKMVAGLGPEHFGALHAAALEQGAQWIHQAPGSGPNDGGSYAATLDSRIDSAGYAAAIDEAHQKGQDDQTEYAAKLIEQQKEATKDLIGKVAFQTIDAGLDIGTFGASEHVSKIIDGLKLLSGTIDNVHEDLGELTKDDPNEAAIKNLQDTLNGVIDDPRRLAQVNMGNEQDQAFMAVRAAALDPSSHLPDGAATDGIPNYAYLGTEGGTRAVNPYIEQAYGSNQAHYNSVGVNSVVAPPPTKHYVDWNAKDVTAQRTYGANQTWDVPPPPVAEPPLGPGQI
jgi:hypothetical protein